MSNLEHNQNISEIDGCYHLHSLTNPAALRKSGPQIVVKGEGIYLYLEDGTRIMDTTSALWNVNLGYGNQRLCEVAYDAMKELSFCQSILGRTNPKIAKLSAKLAEITPDQFTRFSFCSSGSEAIETSVKLALYYWRSKGRPTKRVILSRNRSYHGNTIFAASLTGQDIYHKQFGFPLAGLVHHLDSTYCSLDGEGRNPQEYVEHILGKYETDIIAIGPENIAAFVGEPIQTGMIIPEESYWPNVRRLCDKYEILLIADEVVSGFGKSGKMFGFENFGFEPDLFAVAKSLSSGYFPISAVAIGEKVNASLDGMNELFGHVFTNSGHPVGAAVALEAIAILEDELLVERIRDRTGPHLSRSLAKLLDLPCVQGVRSLGLMCGFDLDASEGKRTASLAENEAFLARVNALGWERGIAMRGGALCFPMIINEEEIDTALDALRGAIVEASSISPEKGSLRS